MAVQQVVTTERIGAGLALAAGQLVATAGPPGVALVVGAYTLTVAARCVINTGGAAAWTLPDPATHSGVIFYLANQGTGTITLSRPVRSAMSGNLTTLPAAAASNTLAMISDGTRWRRIGR